MTFSLLVLQALQWAALPPAVRPYIAGSEAEFQSAIQAIERTTADRLRRGEDEHFAYFVLQSHSFTSLPPVEPALSAKEFHEGKGSIPPAAAARIDAFQAALARPARDARLAWFQRHPPPDPRAAYMEAMGFLQAKEFEAAPTAYQQRGLSSDARPEASFPVWTALAILKRLEPDRKIRRVLIVGPGMDWAPRTGFDDALPPVSYQPALVHDAVIHWRFAKSGELDVHSVDVNPRVVEFLSRPSRRVLITPLAGAPDYREFDEFARRALAGSEPRRISASRLNILTQRLEAPAFDLVVVTNVFLYFNSRDLALALASIHSMLAPGGWLFHNEPRAELEAISRALGMGPVQARVFEVARGARRPLVDTVVMHRKQ